MFFLLDGFDHLVDVGLFLVDIHLVVGLVFEDVLLLDLSVLLCKLGTELSEELVIGLLESLNVLVVIS